MQISAAGQRALGYRVVQTKQLNPFIYSMPVNDFQMVVFRLRHVDGEYSLQFRQARQIMVPPAAKVNCAASQFIQEPLIAGLNEFPIHQGR